MYLSKFAGLFSVFCSQQQSLQAKPGLLRAHYDSNSIQVETWNQMEEDSGSQCGQKGYDVVEAPGWFGKWSSLVTFQVSVFLETLHAY